MPQQQYEFSRKLFLCFKMIASEEMCVAGLGGRLWHNSLPHPGLKSSFLTQLHGPITQVELAAFPRDVGTTGMILPFEERSNFALIIHFLLEIYKHNMDSFSSAVRN